MAQGRRCSWLRGYKPPPPSIRPSTVASYPGLTLALSLTASVATGCLVSSLPSPFPCSVGEGEERERRKMIWEVSKVLNAKI